MNNDPLSWVAVETKIKTLHEFLSVNSSLTTLTLVQHEVIIENYGRVTVLYFKVIFFNKVFFSNFYAKIIYFFKNSPNSYCNYPIWRRYNIMGNFYERSVDDNQPLRFSCIFRKIFISLA